MKKLFNHESFTQILINSIEKMKNKVLYQFLLWITGFFTMISIVVVRLVKGTLFIKRREKTKRINEILLSEEASRYREVAKKEILKKNEFFKNPTTDEELQKQLDQELYRYATDRIFEMRESSKFEYESFSDTLKSLLSKKVFLLASIILSPLMYLLILIYNLPYIKYVFERLIMMIFVLFGVTIIVFTIIYISPTDPAASVLGPDAPYETVENFKIAYGLDQPYHIQLWNTFRKVLTFDLGSSYVGNEDIGMAITRRFPVTLQIGIASLVIALFIAMPAGIISAIKQYSGFDYLLMFIALIGLSIPNFWLGLLMILQLSVRLKWLPATFQAGNYLTMIMPAFVVGTGLSASMARMTRSSMLEVARQDYVTMARAKGLKESHVVIRHMLKNALLPIITVLGMQFAGVLSGAATTEKVFNIRGMCEYIATRTLLPDTPVVIGGVIYIAVAVSISNLVVDIFYTFVDPRLKTRIKNY
jgi:peptide/nickel transport system permease protein